MNKRKQAWKWWYDIRRPRVKGLPIRRPLSTAAKLGGSPIFEFLTLAELEARPEPLALIEGLLHPLDVTLLYGDAKIGKSFLTLDLIAALADGRETSFAGFKVPASDGLPVHFCTAEGERGLRYRLRAATNRRGLDETAINRITTSFLVPDLSNQDEERTVDAFISDVKTRFTEPGRRPKLIVIDTLACASAGLDENDTSQMGLALGRVRRIRDELQSSVILTHHSNRSGSMRGSSVLSGSVESILKVSETKAFKTCLSSDGMKDAPEFLPRFYSLEPDPADQRYVSVKWHESEAEAPSRRKCAAA